VFREIRGLQQREPADLKRWFQDEYFDLFVRHDGAGDVAWFQLCYERNTRTERVLEWRRGAGFQHLKVRQRYEERPGRSDSGSLALDGVLPYMDVLHRFEQSGPGLPARLYGFVAQKLGEYSRPDRKFRRPGAKTPQWLTRMRLRQRARQH
jgi:hypothetical protein